MRAQSKLTVLSLAIVLIFTALIVSQKGFERNRLISLFKQEEEHINSVFDKIIALKGSSLQVFAYDYTFWDEMVNFVEKDDLKWAKENIDVALSTYKANAAWVYKTDGSLLYFTSNIGDSSVLKEILPVKDGGLTKLFSRGPFNHFFIYSPKGLIEIRASTVQPGSDVERKTSARGYFFAGRLWSEEYTQELSRLCGFEIKVNPVPEKIPSQRTSDVEKGIISFARLLRDWRGIGLAKMLVWKESGIIKEFNSSYSKFFLLFVSCVGVFLIVLWFLLALWIRRPLQLVSKALKAQIAGYAEPLLKDKTEFGDIGRIITGFFDQKEELIVEIEKRQEVEEELQKLNAGLEERIKERTEELEGANKELTRAYSNLQQAHRELIQSEKMAEVGLMASGIAHEIKNPVAIVLQGAEYLKAHPACVLLGREIEMIRQAALRADKIIKGLLDFSRQTPLAFEELDAAFIVEDSLGLVEHQMKLSNIRVTKKFSPNLPKIKADSNQLKQVFINILVNAADAMPKGGEVTVALERIGDAPGKVSLRIIFTDTGCGIPQENLKKVFDPFFSTKKKSGSAGLGLAIMQRIIEGHKGSVDVKSKVGAGTSIIINLPAR